MQLSNEQIQKILDGAPDDTWTHIDDPNIETDYLKMDGKFWYMHNGDEWVLVEDSELGVHVDFHSREDIESLLTLRKKVDMLLKDLEQCALRVAELRVAFERSLDKKERRYATQRPNELKAKQSEVAARAVESFADKYELCTPHNWYLHAKEYSALLRKGKGNE